MGRIQKVRMLKRTPRHSYNYCHIFDKVSEQMGGIENSKSIYI